VTDAFDDGEPSDHGGVAGDDRASVEGAADGAEADEPDFDAPGLDAPDLDDDPWPRRCEVVALVVVAAVFGTLVQGVLYSFALSSSDLPISVAARFRIGSQVLSPFLGLLLIVATVLVALDGITSGERRGPTSRLGQVALNAALVLALLVGLGSAIRSVDMLLGHTNPIGFGPSSWPSRLEGAVAHWTSLAVALAAAWLAARTLGDGDLMWAFRRAAAAPDADGFDADAEPEGYLSEG